MTSASQLNAFAAATTIDVPTVSYQVGVSASTTTFKDFHNLSEFGGKVVYDAKANTVCVLGDNVVLSGYNFSGTNLVVKGNNTTLSNDKFDASTGYVGVRQMNGTSGLVI